MYQLFSCVDLEAFLTLMTAETEAAAKTSVIPVLSLKVGDVVLALAPEVGEWDRVVVIAAPNHSGVLVRSLDYGGEYEASDIRYLTDNLAKYPMRAQRVLLSGTYIFVRNTCILCRCYFM